ncbi:MAG: filamentous hemagglutinin N-terminal domain-containing protein [Candidatus Pacebacteria bacterium]|nr:filamentous hemagglutinin N-terminal domain-containing protein [Candidatus Paceibacterota bacterium]
MTDLTLFSPRRLSLILATTAIAAILTPSPRVMAAPTGGTIAAGSATISQNGTATTIRQESDRAVIDWQGFDLAADESVSFTVPTARSATLNRIHGSAVSTISGQVTSNGQVYFVNANGLVFDVGSRITANGFFASTAAMSNQSFMNSPNPFPSTSFPNDARITLDGTVTASTILVSADQIVMTRGQIESRRGQVDLNTTSLTSLGAAAVIRADEGRVRLWSDGVTNFDGFIHAAAGFVEVSGHDLNFNGSVDTQASDGRHGTLLIDPATVVIGSGSVPGVSYIRAATLVALLATSDVTIQANSGTTTPAADLSLIAGGYGTITVSEPVNSQSISNYHSLTLEGTSIFVTAPMTLKGGLILNSNSLSVMPLDGRSGVTISANITLGTVGDGVSNLTVNQVGTVTGSYGILVENSTLSIGGRLNFTANGRSNFAAIAIENATITTGGSLTFASTPGSNYAWVGIELYNSNLTSGGDLTLIHDGEVGQHSFFLNGSINLTSSGDVNLLQLGTAMTDALFYSDASLTNSKHLTITAGGATTNWITIKTNNQILELVNPDPIQFRNGQVRIDLGTSRLSGTHQVIDASDTIVYYSGATSGMNATLNLASGGLVFVKDRSAVTGPVVLDSTVTADDAMIGWGSGFNFSGSGTTTGSVTSFTNNGFTVTIDSSGALSNVQNLGVVYGGAVEISSLSSAAASELFYISGSSISVTTGTSQFNHGLVLNSRGGAINLGANLSLQGELQIKTQGGNLSLASSIVTSGGALYLNLGNGQLISNGNSLTTGNKNLTLNAAAVTGVTSDSASLFNLGTGTYFDTKTNQIGVLAAGKSIIYYSDSGTGTAIEGVDWHPISELAGQDHFTTGVARGNVTADTTKGSFVTVSHSGGIVLYGDIGFYGLGSTGTAVSQSNAIEIRGGSLIIIGSNSFSGNLNITSQGIRQAANASLTVGGVLTVTSTGGDISLGNGGNNINQLGTLTTAGRGDSIVINNGTNALRLGGNLTAGVNGRISLTAGGLSLLQTQESRGAVEINLGTGYYNNRLSGTALVWSLGSGSESQTLSLTIGGFTTPPTQGETYFTHVASLTARGAIGLSSQSNSGGGYPTLAFDAERRAYFTTLSYSADPNSSFKQAEQELLLIDPRAQLHPQADRLVSRLVTHQTSAGVFLTSGSVNWRDASFTQTVGGVDLPSAIGFYRYNNATSAGMTLVANSTIVFAGRNQFSSREIDWSSQTNIQSIVFAADSNLNNSLIVPNNFAENGRQIRLEANANLPGLRGSPRVTLVFTSDWQQNPASNRAITLALNIQSASTGPIRLRFDNSQNQISAISGLADLYQLNLKSNVTIDIGNLNIRSGSLVARVTGGGLSGTNFTAGSIHFAAEGAVALNGSYGLASGYGSAVSLASSAIAVYGAITSDTSLTIGGTAKILTSDLNSRGGGAISVEGGRSTIAANMAINSNSGAVTLATELIPLKPAPLVGIVVSTGVNGKIDLPPDYGRQLSLGWIAFNGFSRNGFSSLRSLSNGYSYLAKNPLTLLP